MKKFLFLGAMAAMLLGTASCSNDMEPEMTDGTVQFKVELPGNIDSRAISDGTTATKLDVACYDADGNVLTTLNPTVSDFENRVATVTVKLVKGQKYNFAFFAHAKYKSASYPQFDYYKFEPGEKFEDCKFVYNGRHTTSDFANNEERDAFYGTLTNYEVKSEQETVTLTRPFAQLNLGIDDLEAAQAAGIEPRNVRITIRKASKAFNIASGMASAAPEDAVESLFYYYENKDEAGAMPWKKGETLTVDGKDYTWISMNYLLVPENEANLDIEVKIHTTKTIDGTDGQDFEFTVPSVPFKKNHRTNILGSLLTQEGNFKVIIDQNFDEPDLKPETVWDGTLSEPADITGDIIEIKDGSELAWVMNSISEGTTLAGKTFKLTDDINLGKKDWPLVNVKCSFTLDGNNKTIKGLKSTGGNYGGLIGKANNNVVIKNLTITDSEIDAAGRTDNENAAGAFIGWCENHTSTAISLVNCKSENVKVGKAQYNGGLVGYSSRININNCIVLNTETISDYAEGETYKGHTGCIVGYGNFDTTITNTCINDSKISGKNDKGRVGIFYGTAQASVTIGTGNSVKNVTILGATATSANLVGAVDNRSDKSNDGTVVFE